MANSAITKQHEGGEEMEREAKLSVTLDTEQFEQAIRKANELVETIDKAKALVNDLAYMMQELNFKPSLSEIPADER